MSKATKVCSQCGETKDLSEFHTCKHTRDQKNSSCKVCACKAATKAYRNNPAKGQKNTRRNWLKRAYGLTELAYQQMLDTQGGVCQICHRPNLNGTRLAVDHDHVTGELGGLLCMPCNTALGFMQDSPDRLRAAAAYLELHRPAHRMNQHGRPE